MKDKIRIIGPEAEAMNKYMDDVSGYLSKAEDSDNEDVDKIDEQLKERVKQWLSGCRQKDQIKQRIKIEYEENHGFFNADSEPGKSMYIALKEEEIAKYVNVIIIKLKRENNYSSYYDIFFFGNSADKRDNVPDEFVPYTIYYSSIELLAKIWRGYIEKISITDENTRWFEEFFK